MKQAYFISLEGIEGAGKSTALHFISDYLQQKQIPYYCTREPGGTPLGEAMRQLLLAPDHSEMSALTELLLIFAARAQHVHQIIIPRLKQGIWVISDRFTDATYAYQGGGRGLDWQQIKPLEQMIGLQPDLTFLLDLPVEIGLQRVAQRSAADRIEAEKADFFERVRRAYLDRAAAEPERIHIIDANRPLDAVQKQMIQILDAWMGAG